MLTHSDQDRRFIGVDRAASLRAHDPEPSMRRGGTCHDTADAGAFNLPERERIGRRTYRTREEARQDVSDDLEMFLDPEREHARNGLLWPVDFARRRKPGQPGVREKSTCKKRTSERGQFRK